MVCFSNNGIRKLRLADYNRSVFNDNTNSLSGPTQTSLTYQQDRLHQLRGLDSFVVLNETRRLNEILES